ncbi:AraC family transcriptional regulator [Nocardioides marmoriginsengisoli]|uniref:AraC family transcriptional regulator n=1 Tax=Nocardioides marmoriginsengisoli TaxID=661483 RepID=A0A3N0CPY6_9ACTN|nr:AraC family transcriptional regulator [Nocardioides marmoriginsengisoli]
MPAVPDQEPRDAALADALKRLHIQGAIFLHARYTEGWAYSSVPTEDLAALLAPQARRIVPFHLVAEGRCWIEVGGDRHWADAGDVIVLPYGDPHLMGGTEDSEIVDAMTLVDPPPWTSMPFIEYGHGGDPTHVVCGYLTSEDRLFDADLRVFPPVLVVHPTGSAAEWVRASIDYALTQTSLVDSEHAESPAHLVQLLFVEVLRLYLAEAPAPELGFIRAIQNPVLAPAMALIHRSPERKWTVAELASAAAVSESLLDERFRGVLGLAPIRYLTAWRMHLAQDLLTSTELGVAAIARRVGYESEEAFSRAFKRKHETSPSAWRVRGRAG